MKLSIIIPVLNEEKTIERVLRKLISLEIQGIEKEILVVNDGSTDKTGEILNRFIKKEIRVLNHETPSGKGSAIKTGIAKATGEYVLIQDADDEYDPKYISILLKPVLGKNTSIVYGTRLKRLPHISREEKTFRFFLHYLGNRFLSLLTSILYGQWITDMETGYKLIDRRLLSGLDLKSKGFDFEPEVTAKLLKKGHLITEIPITTVPRDFKKGKKLRTFHDGFIALWTLIRFRFFD